MLTLANVIAKASGTFRGHVAVSNYNILFTGLTLFTRNNQLIYR